LTELVLLRGIRASYLSLRYRMNVFGFASSLDGLAHVALY
jgi:hypothetical protein